MALWQLHHERDPRGDALPGARLAPAVVGPQERVGWPLTLALGLQHAAAVFFACVLVPSLTGLPIATTLLFSGLGTCLFLLVTRNRVPGYLGASFAFLAPLAAARGDGIAAQLGGVLAAGLLLTAVGVAVKSLGVRFLEALLPPAVTGAVVLLVGVSVAPPAALLLFNQPLLTVTTVVVVLLVSLLGRGTVRRFAVLVGMLLAWGIGALAGLLPSAALAAVGRADWFGWPDLYSPVLHPSVAIAMLPAVIVLAAEYVGHIKAVSAAAGQDLDAHVGDAMIGGGLATVLAGMGGAAPMTNSVGNLGVFATSRVYSTAPCAVGGVVAVLLAFCPKLTAVLGTLPAGAVGGAAIVAVAMILRIALRIWHTGGVHLADPVTVLLTVIAVLAGAAGVSLTVSGVRFDGVALGALAIVIGYPLLAKLPFARVTARVAAALPALRHAPAAVRRK